MLLRSPGHKLDNNEIAMLVSQALEKIMDVENIVGETSRAGRLLKEAHDNLQRVCNYIEL
jgi:hypothetical protein